MIKAVLIDDEPLARSILLEYLEAYPQIEVMAECNDGFEGAKAIMEHDPDLVFLDVQMPKINGFEMLEIIDKQPAIIFTTAFDEYAIQAFEKHATDYLLKPITRARFDKAMDKFLASAEQGKPAELVHKTTALLDNVHQDQTRIDRILVKHGVKIKIIPADQIIYLEADDDYVKIHTPEGSFLKNKTMAAFERLLDPAEFLRVHRSFIVRIEHINRLEPYEKDSHVAILSNGARVSVSKNGLARLKQMLGM